MPAYLGTPADTYLAWLLRAHEAKLRVKERHHPKLYWVDPLPIPVFQRELKENAI